MGRFLDRVLPLVGQGHLPHHASPAWLRKVALGAGDLQRSAYGSSTLETVYHFTGSGIPTGGGTAIALPADESWMIYRTMTRAREALVLIEKFQ